jgi:hypothetical protein
VGLADPVDEAAHHFEAAVALRSRIVAVVAGAPNWVATKCRNLYSV